MPTRSGGYISRSYSVEGLSIAFSVGVLLAAMTGGGYIAAAVSLIMIVLAGDRLIAVVLCGMFAYTSFMLSGTVITPPKFATDASTGICSYIDSLPMRNTGLMKAFLQGDKTGLTKDITTAFRAAGASHLLALSGLHLGIIYAVIERPLRFLGRQEKVLQMKRVAAMFRLKLKDEELPASFAKMKFDYTGGSANYNPTTGQGITKSTQAENRLRSDSNVYEIYTFPYLSETGTLQITASALDGAGNVLIKHTFKDVPMRVNTITSYEGEFFGDMPGEVTATTVGFTVDPAWATTNTYTF